ncbi:hypothetical protein BDV93DRAFT_608518, partial [Ceratobasidium sp. AG-I]
LQVSASSTSRSTRVRRPRRTIHFVSLHVPSSRRKKHKASTAHSTHVLCPHRTIHSTSTYATFPQRNTQRGKCVVNGSFDSHAPSESNDPLQAHSCRLPAERYTEGSRRRLVRLSCFVCIE